MQDFGKRVTNDTLRIELQKQVLDVLDPTGSRRHKLPLRKLTCVPFPKALTKERLDAIDWTDMTFSPKIDGIRALLMCCQRGVFLIDRHFDFYRLPDAAGAANEAKEMCQFLTLIDVECKIIEQRKYVFALDPICYQAQPLHRKPRLARYTQLKDIVSALSPVLLKHCDLRLVFKPFFPVSSMCSSDAKAEGISASSIPLTGMWGIEGVAVQIDGQICMSNRQPYLSSHVSTLVKVKEHDTVDVFAALDDVTVTDDKGLSQSQIRVWYLDKDNKERIPFTDTGRIAISDALLEEARRESKSKVCCCECLYDRERGVWRVYKPRPDKPHANYYAVVKETLELAQKPITMDMIKAKFAEQHAHRAKRKRTGEE